MLRQDLIPKMESRAYFKMFIKCVIYSQKTNNVSYAKSLLTIADNWLWGEFSETIEGCKEILKEISEGA
jgi:hypothetical protein